jgi:hypothetical protein
VWVSTRALDARINAFTRLDEQNGCRIQEIFPIRAKMWGKMWVEAGSA